MVPYSCTKDKNSIKKIVVCVVCYSASKYGHTFLLLVCIVALGKIIAPHLFLILKNSILYCGPIELFLVPAGSEM